MIRLSTHIHNKSAKNSVVSAAKAARGGIRPAGKARLAVALLSSPWLSSARLGAAAVP